MDDRKKHNNSGWCIDKLTIETIKNVREDLKKGILHDKIIKKYGISRYYLRKILKEEPIAISEKNLDLSENNDVKLTGKMCDEIIEKIREDLSKKLTMIYISKKYGITVYRIRKIRENEIVVS